MGALDQLVPEDHLVRKMEEALGFSFIYNLVKDMYSEAPFRAFFVYKMTLD